MAQQNKPGRKSGMAIIAYGLATRCVGPLLPRLLDQRLKRGKEISERLAERRGIAGRPRPDTLLVWLHAASVGEALSILGLIDKLLAARNDLHVLVTTGTVTSAELMGKYLPPRAFHQFVPLDHPDYCARFMDHWRPDAAVWVESEFWPNLILAARNRGTKLALINARLTEKSFRGWKRFPGMIRTLLGSFSLICAQDHKTAERLRLLAGKSAAAVIETPGNLKHDAAPLSVDETALAGLRKVIDGRPVWLATNTHPGEEEIAARTHEILKRQYPDLLTLIVPRHPMRGEALAAAFTMQDLNVARRSLGEKPLPETDIYLGDTMGELGLFYRLCHIVFVGGTIAPMGGHNPFEAARLDAALIAGPSDFNFAEAYAGLEEARGLIRITDGDKLAEAVARLLTDTDLRASSARAARAFAAETKGTTNHICEKLLMLLPQAPETGQLRMEGTGQHA